MKAKFAVPIIIAALIGGFYGGIEYQKSSQYILQIDELSNKETDKPEAVDFSLFWEAWKKLSDRFVDRSELDPQQMIYGAIRGLVSSTGDPYTVFLEPQETKKFREEISGSFGGVGIEIGIRGNILTVIAPIKGTPGEQAGLLAGDKIIEIDSEDTQGITLEEAVDKIRGLRGTKVTLTVFRDEFDAPRDFEIIRDTIRIPAASWEIVDGNIGYIQLHTFNTNIDREFRNAAQFMLDNNVDRIILDLRNNPGGLLDMSVRLASWFLDRNQIVVTEDFGNGEKNEFKSENTGVFKETPVVILINQGSASASEILAGALRDHRNILLIGAKTFGKGSVQQIEDLKQGSLKITVAKWLTPKGHSINDEGLEPDIAVEFTPQDRDEDKDPQLDKAIEVIKTL